MSYDHKSNAWRIADKFMELPKARRAELAKEIEKESRDLAALVTHQVIQEYKATNAR
jgi:hypothetical protein